ncbi:MAG: phosphoribosylglycinamide formyltransferase [Spirochaetes bacterium]|nr:phosphoribosylglycinamide formyltransferase [Spirochaetota bacterium]
MDRLADFFKSKHSRTLKTGQKPAIVILISSRGSNMRAILEKIREGKLEADCKLVVSDREAPGLDVAKKMGFQTELFLKRKSESREEFDERLAARLKEENPTLVVCAGYLKIITVPLLRAFPQRIVNIHPSLLPAFPGLKAQRQALEYGVKVTGCTIHLVDHGVDTGKILAQAAVRVESGDNEATLSLRILKAEHALYWQTIAQYLSTCVLSNE